MVVALNTLAFCSLLICAACESQLRSVASQRGNILGELTNAEHLIQSQLRGNPKIMEEEMTLLHGAEAAARRNDEIEEHHHAKVAPGTKLLQQKASNTEGLNKDSQLLSTARTEVEQLLHAHPAVLKKEEQALNQAMSAIHELSKPVASFVETKTNQAQTISLSALEQQRRSSMAAALHEKRTYAAAEDSLAAEGGKILSKFGNLKDAIAQAFAGKDSNAVKTAMEVGEIVDGAEAKQQEVVKMNHAEAAKAKQEAAAQATALAQMSTQSKAQQEQRAYTSGMARLATDEKATLEKFAGLKAAVAQTFAGKDSKAVEKAMEVGELLDQARHEQEDVLKKDQTEASTARDIFHKLQAHA